MVKLGYKQTEIGIIPEDWDIVELKEAFPKLEAGVSVNSDSTLFSDYYVLKTSAVHDGRIDCDEAKPVIARDYNRLKCPLVPGSIVFSRMNTPQLVGECGYVKEVNNGTFLPDRLWLIRNPVGSEFDFEWLNYLLNTRRYRDAVRATATGTSNSMKNISKDRLLEIFIPKPKIDEQKRIAEALSDIDALINNLEELVAKKKAIKQGAMQELLTGKKRLPGFDGRWIAGKWKDVLEGFSSGATPYRGNSSFYNGTIKWVSSGELNYNRIFDTIEHISQNAQIKANLSMHPAGTFLMAITGLEAAGTRGSCAILGSPATTNQSCMAIYGTKRMSTEYLFHYYVYHGDELAFQYCQGTKQQSYTAAIVKELPIYYPEDVREQNAIASLLTDMDNEIEELKQKLDKYRLVKQGMMQQLLTGKIRLV